MKRPCFVLSLVVTGLFLWGMVGCGSTPPTTESTPPSESATTTTSTTTSATAASSATDSTTTNTTVGSVTHTTHVTAATTTTKKTTTVPFKPRAKGEELRGVWVSYLDLEEYLAGTTPARAKKALDAIMDTCAARGLNTVYFHVRSHSDAWYASSVFPAATVAAPLLKAGFDPLAYAIEAAHRRGLELHAWLNPYRVGEDKKNAVVAGSQHLFQKGGSWYYNPASEAVRQKLLAGVRELVKRYAVDGIHFDDYFYPLDMAAQGEAFEDIPAGADVAAWRRTQVSALVSAVYGLVHTKPRCVFGISPAANLENCLNKLFADVPTWIAKPGYVDYICPQIYFGFENETLPYTATLAQWLALPRQENVELHVGLALYKVGLKEDTHAGTGRQEWATGSDILARQVTALRQQKANGFVLFRYNGLLGGTPALDKELAALDALF